MTSPRGSWVLVGALGSALSHGEANLSAIPGLLTRIIEEGHWRRFETPLGQLIEHDSIREFVTAPPLPGLGVEWDYLKKLLGADPKALEALDRADQQPRGRPVSENPSNRRLSSEVGGTTAVQALRRLRKDAPEMHEKVLAGELSPHAGMVEAGLRQRTISVPADDAAAAARRLKKNMTPQVIEELVQLLQSSG